MLASPLSGTVIRRLSDGPTGLVDLRRECGSAAQTTLRARLKELEEIGVVARHRCERFPGVIECELTKAGRELLFVAAVLEQWLQAAPDGPLRFGTGPAKAAITALVDGWSSSMLRILAARPLSLAELDSIIDSLSYPALQRRLAAMRLAGQLEPCPDQSDGTNLYRVTKWLRQSVAPLTAATRWERRHLPADTLPIAPIDTEASFLLALPLLRLPSELNGSCRMGVEMTKGKEHRLAGAIAHADGGRVRTCTVRLNSRADAWAIGPATAWQHAVIDSDTAGLELGGSQRLAHAVLDALHDALFGARFETVPYYST